MILIQTPLFFLTHYKKKNSISGFFNIILTPFFRICIKDATHGVHSNIINCDFIVIPLFT